MDDDKEKNRSKMQQNDTDRLSSVRLHKNRRSLKLLWRHESSSSSMKEVEKA